MAIDNPRVIDLIGTNGTTGEILLAISDHLEWDERDEHLLLLQEKLNVSIGFIEAGELLENSPDAAGRPVRIDVVCKSPPNEDGERFLSLASKTIQEAGWSLSWRCLPSGESDD